jgi:hypothetical protein
VAWGVAVVALLAGARWGGGGGAGGGGAGGLAGAAGWGAAQVAKLLSALLLAVALAPGRRLAEAVSGLAPPSPWYVLAGAALPAFWEQAASYGVLCRLGTGAAGSSGFRRGLAVGLGAGAAEALVVGAAMQPLARTPTHGLALAVWAWERAWSAALHGGLGTLAGAAAARGSARPLVLAMALHFLAELPLGRLQQVVAAGGTGWPGTVVGAESLLALAALAALGLGRLEGG